MAETTESTELPPFPWTGHCACNLVNYSIDASPLAINSCHCHHCQIESGSACAVNYVVEKSHFKYAPLLSSSFVPFFLSTLLSITLLLSVCHHSSLQSISIFSPSHSPRSLTTTPRISTAQPLLSVATPSESKKNQLIVRCPRCYVALYSHYAMLGPTTVFVRLGTLDVAFATHLTPDFFIYQDFKMPWFCVPAGRTAFARFYAPAEEWSTEAKARMALLGPAVGEWTSAQGCWELEWEKAGKEAESDGDVNSKVQGLSVKA